MHSETVNRFWAKVNKTDTCWLWTASTRNKGYGAFVWADPAGRIINGRAHRFSYELAYGPISPSICVLHKCDVPACVRPDHLFLGTKADNNRDMVEKGRHVPGGTYARKEGKPLKYVKGTNHPMVKITPEIVRSIREEKATASYSQLRAKYGLAAGHIHRIVTRKVWAHVE